MLKKRLLTNQKGLSAIVSTLIIILLVLVAVGIIWVVVRGIVQEGAEGIELGKLTLDLEIKAAQIENGDVTLVVVRRNPGEGNYIGMNFIFSDGTNSEIIREDTVLQELEEQTFTFTLTEISTYDLETISVAPIFELSSGKESVGNIADDFEVTEEMKAGITDGAVSNFEMLGYSGAGKMEYGPFSSDTPKLPEFRKAIVDPLDVLPGDNQTFTAHVYSPYSVTSVTSVTELDNSTLYLDFEKIDEYTEENETIEIWFASWIVNDTHAIEYRTNVTAIDSEANSNFIVLTWTDSCQAAIGAHGADRIINQDCSTGTLVNGLDGGSLTIASLKTVIIDSGGTLAFNDGKSITVTGTITVTGQIKKSNLYYTDGDGDGYAPTATLALSGGVRAMSALGTSDCNDGNINAWSYGYGYDGDNDGYGTSSYGCNNGPPNYDATLGTDCSDGDADIYRNVAGMILDNDHDRYSTGSSATRCVGAKSSYWYKGAEGTYKWISTSDDLGTNDCNDANSGDWRLRYSDSDGDGHCPGSGKTCVGNDAGYRDSCTSYNDCCDTDSRAKPGQTTYYATPRSGCGGYDYNCDSVESRESTQLGKCYNCWFDDGGDFRCHETSPGTTTGWSYRPACGGSALYITNIGYDCAHTERRFDETNCEDPCYGGSSESRTMKCR